MELWIRSQDREKLCKAYYISLNYESNLFWLSNNDGKIYTTIGTYKTKERALEVLDEIQNIINQSAFYEEIDAIKFIGKAEVYKMPEE